MVQKIPKLTKAEEILIMFLAAKNGEKIGSLFKLEIMVFLISRTDKKLEKLFNFVPSKRGPHSKVFHKAINGLIKKGLIEFEQVKP